MTTEVRQLRAELARAARKMRRLVAVLIAKIEELPDNPRIRRVPGPASCFVMRSSDLGSNWTPAHHDFNVQYRAVKAALLAVKPARVMGRLRTIIKTGQIVHSKKAGDKIVLHKDVIAHLRTLLD
jgi:hypothetical protein